MKIREIIQRIKTIYSKGVSSDDSRLSSRYLYSKMISLRAKLILEQANKKQKVSQWNYQTIPCIELIEVPKHLCPCVPPSGCTILRSKHILPSPITGLSSSLIQGVYDIEGNTRIEPQSINSIRFSRGNKFTSKEPKYFIEQGYLYVITPLELNLVKVVGLFEDPILVKTYETFCNDCKDCVSCIDYNEEEFPLDLSLVEPLIQLLTQEIAELFLKITEDTRNDGKDSRQ